MTIHEPTEDTKKGDEPGEPSCEEGLTQKKDPQHSQASEIKENQPISSAKKQPHQPSGKILTNSAHKSTNTDQQPIITLQPISESKTMQS